MLKLKDLKKAPIPNDIGDSDELWESANSLGHFRRMHWNRNSEVKTNQRPDGTYYHVIPSKNETTHLITQDSQGNDPIAHMIVAHSGPGQNAKVEESVVDKPMRGKGYGKSLYLNALKHHGQLDSDITVSPQANKIYQGLARHPNVSAKLDSFPGDGQHHLKFVPNKKLAASELDKAIKSPSKNIPLHRLKQLQTDNYVGETGKEYDEHETKHAILDRQINQADKDVLSAKRYEKQLANQMANPQGGHTPQDLSWMFTGKRRMAKSLFKKDTPNSSVKINPEHGRIIADAYHEMKHEPNHPEVKAAYGALIHETKQQYKSLIDGGVKVSKIKNGQNPYPTSKHLHQDLDQNRIQYFPTESGFGSDDNQHKDHPMLQPTEFKDDEGKPMLANDLFRVVHDTMHHKLRNGFGPKGEHESFLEHKKYYSPLAQKALATETKAQNSFVNFSSQIGHLNQQKPGSAYAPQKAGLLPEHILNGKWHE